MSVHLLVAGILINSINLVLHSIGITLLRSLHETKLKSDFTTLLINLSINEWLFSLVVIIKNTAKLSAENEANTANKLAEYLAIIELTGLGVVYYFLMIYIPLYRLAKMLLGMKYSAYWSSKRMVNLCICTWSFDAFIYVVITIMYRYYELDYVTLFYKYVYPPIEIIFLALSVTTYVYIYKKVSKSMTRLKNYKEDKKKYKSEIIAKFYIPTLLIISFIIFMIVPDLIVLIYFIVLQKYSPTVDALVTMMYAISLTVDALIYIFGQKEVRQALLSKICCYFRRNQINDRCQSRSDVFTVASKCTL